jgi:hypothetical protein
VGTLVMVASAGSGGVGSVQDITGGTAPRSFLFPQVKHAAQSFVVRDYLDWPEYSGGSDQVFYPT